MVSVLSGNRARSDEDLFAAWEEDLRSQNAGVTKAVLLEIEARLLRLALSAQNEQPPSVTSRKSLSVVGDSGLRKVEQMACFIAQNYTERLTVDLIASVVRLHPNYAMNLFRKSFGTTLIEYVTQHRVSHAQRLLVTSSRKVVDIAIASGFGSISRFNDAFQRVCRCSPREYRKQYELMP
jgi:AraC-like DNA-binding protein